MFERPWIDAERESWDGGGFSASAGFPSTVRAGIGVSAERSGGNSMCRRIANASSAATFTPCRLQNSEKASTSSAGSSRLSCFVPFTFVRATLRPQ